MSPPRRQSDRPLIRRDADGSERTGSGWETLTERLIREAQEDGAFEGLPSHGRPLDLDDDRYAGDMAAANRILRNAGAAPPWIEIDKEARRSLELIEAVIDRASRSSTLSRTGLEQELEQHADTYDQAVARLEVLAPTPRQRRSRLDRTRLRRRLAHALADDGTMP